MLCIHYEVSKDGFTLQSLYLTFELLKYFKIHIATSPILNHAFDFWLAEKYFEPSWISGLAKIEPAGPVPPSL